MSGVFLDAFTFNPVAVVQQLCKYALYEAYAKFRAGGNSRRGSFGCGWLEHAMTKNAKSVWPLLLALLGVFISPPVWADDAEPPQNPALKRFYTELQTLFRHQYPKVTSDLLKDKMHFECDTRLFIVHEADMGGRWQDPSEERGPMPGGVLCDITLEKGPYQGQAFVPQTYDKHYFKVLQLAPYSEKHDEHLEVQLYYPRNMSDDFLQQFTDLVNHFEKYVD